jgi:hypothetical protein
MGVLFVEAVASRWRPCVGALRPALASRGGASTCVMVCRAAVVTILGGLITPSLRPRRFALPP